MFGFLKRKLSPEEYGGLLIKQLIQEFPAIASHGLATLVPGFYGQNADSYSSPSAYLMAHGISREEIGAFQLTYTMSVVAVAINLMKDEESTRIFQGVEREVADAAKRNGLDPTLPKHFDPITRICNSNAAFIKEHRLFYSDDLMNKSALWYQLAVYCFDHTIRQGELVQSYKTNNASYVNGVLLAFNQSLGFAKKSYGSVRLV